MNRFHRSSIMLLTLGERGLKCGIFAVTPFLNGLLHLKRVVICKNRSELIASL